MSEPIRVLVVEDSLTVRRYLRGVLESAPGMRVVAEAADGQEAIRLCEELRPDVVTMDMMLPVMSGLAATEYIMAHCPAPILIVSASLNRGEVFKTYEALAAGAVDVIEKPSGFERDGAWDAAFVDAVRVVSRVRPIRHLRGRLANGAVTDGRRAVDVAERLTAPAPAPAPARVVAIGASTGGPAAILGVLKALPRPFPVPILLVLHINEPFGTAFAQWLDGQTGLRVQYAKEGAPVTVTAGRVSMAPPDWHLEVRHGRFRLNRGAPRNYCRPSVDVLFQSVALDYGTAAAACLLTGMGRDGAAGLLAIRHAGGHTIAQDESSSVVYGMPREAALIGAAGRILPISQIGAALARAVLPAHEEA